MKTYKFKLYSSKRNKKLHRQIDIAGSIYNHCIALHRRYYRIFKKSLTTFSLSKHLAKLKKISKYTHWKLVGSQAIQDISERIGRAYRNDFLQKQSTMLVRENQTICIEDLNVKGMIRNHKLAKSIASVSWAKFFEMLEYKAIWYGNEIRRVPTMYPSSQTCSFCGCRNPLVKNLCIRIWECPKCHTVHDRDTNASINILKKGLQMQSA